MIEAQTSKWVVSRAFVLSAICVLMSWLFAGALVLGGAPAAKADVAINDEGTLKVYGDFRLRYEVDWDSQRGNGKARDDRSRMRMRARLGTTYSPIPDLTFGARVRTGAVDSQQSPHITILDLSGNPTGDEDIMLDKWFAKGKRESAWGWLGRNGFPFWKQNELFWDDDVTPVGAAAGGKLSVSGGTLALNGGYFTLPDGGVDLHGRLGAVQAVYSTKVRDVALTGAGGLFRFDGEAGADNLRNGNGARDYTIWALNLQARTNIAGQPVTFGLDGMFNTEDYAASDADPFSAANRDETEGFVASVMVGKLKEAGDWLGAYYYAHIETLAVHASYAQDDWFRFGSATQTDSSDFKGHELRAAYAIASNMNVVARLYIVDAITSIQDGNRFRLDFNVKF